MTVPPAAEGRRYVLGVDGSSPADAAARWIMSRLEFDPAPVAIVFALPVDKDAPSSEETAAAAADLLTRMRNCILRRHPHAAVTCHAVTGTAPTVLTRFARPSDLLVIGTHKTGFLHGRVTGTTGLQTVSLSHSPVLVVPDVELRFRAGVVAGIGAGTEAVQQVAYEAGREATLRGAEVLLIHAGRNPVSMHAEDDLALATAVDTVHKQSPRAVVISRVTSRNPVDTLLDAARDKALLILGSPAPRDDVPWGSSVIHDVLLNLTAPVLITRTAPASLAAAPAKPTLVTT